MGRFSRLMQVLSLAHDDALDEVRVPVKVPEQRLEAYVNCGRGIEFVGDFIVGMTLAELLEWLKECCSTRPLSDMDVEIEWLPERLRLASGKEIGMEYVIQAGDVLNLADPELPAPPQQKLLA